MYFPIGWPKVLKLEHDDGPLREICSNKDRILFAVLTFNGLSIWFCRPCLPLISYSRSQNSIEDYGTNEKIEWRPDSSMIVVSTSGGYLIFYKLAVDESVKTVYNLVDSPNPSLKRDCAELFVKENIPSVNLILERHVNVGGGITTMVCIRDELMISTVHGHILRYRWDGGLNRDYCLDLRRIPFCIDKQVSKALPIFEQNKYIIDIDYSPLVGGFAVVFNDGRAAVLTASSLKFDPNEVQGIWAPNIEDATCCSTNHRYRLIVFGRKNSQAIVYTIDEQTGGLEVSHSLIVSTQVYPGDVGAVQCFKWSPDGCALALSWSSGGFSVWSTFGALLVCSLGWGYGLHVDLSKFNPIRVTSIEWAVEGYQLWMTNKGALTESSTSNTDCVLQFEFLKSALTVNPCMSHQTHLFLQGADKLYVNLGSGGLTKVYQMQKPNDSLKDCVTVKSTLVESKQWVIVPLPATYLSTNWPVRYSAIDADGKYIAVAGRFGLAHYSMITHKWKLFGNEIQEKDMVVMGGLLWWRSCIIAGCYSFPHNEDQIRIYPREPRLSNSSMTSVSVNSQILLIDCLWDKLIVFCADGKLHLYSMCIVEANAAGGIVVDLDCIQMIDISALCIHPACVISVTLTVMKTEPRYSEQSNNSFVLNVSGKLLLVNQQDEYIQNSHVIPAPILLASCVENIWVPSKFRKEKPHLTEALWLFCGSHGMRVWLPLFPKDGDKTHTFMSKRIMLPFKLKIYPLAILFEDAILLGAENDTTLYTSNPTSVFSLPFNVLERTSQVYLHQILRQLIRRNLGFHAWEVARCCENLPYFPHSLELLLHEVLEEEATSKEPIPDAQLPSVIEFIQEFPVYLKTVVQCARKTEIALWPYLFSAAGKPKDLFQECLSKGYLETAASYLIILQNLESSVVSRQYAALLLDATLDNSKWELSKDLVRFFRAIDPTDNDSRNAAPCKLTSSSQTTTVQPNEEDLSFLLSSMQVTRGRSFSTATQPKVESVGARSLTGQSSSSGRSRKRKKSAPSLPKTEKSQEAITPNEEFFLDVILQRHARRLLSSHRLQALGYFAAHLDFRLVEWLHRERESAARVDNFINALKHLHSEFSWPYPVLSQPLDHFLQRKLSTSLSSVPSNCSYDKNSQYTFSQNAGNDINSAVGDSGYMSCQDHIPLRSHDVQMQPHVFDARSVISEGDESTWWADEQEHCSTDSWNDIPSVHVLEQLSSELSSRGSNKADVQLRYLLQIFMEAGCLEWCLVVSILLRDVLAIHRVSNAARSPDQSYDAVVRLREGFLSLWQWSNTECIGYKPLMIVACQSQVSVLNKLLGTKQRNVTPPPVVSSPATRTRSLSSNFDNMSQSTLNSSQLQLNASSQLPSSSDASSLLDEINSPTLSDGKSNDDTVSVTSQKSTSSCVIS